MGKEIERRWLLNAKDASMYEKLSKDKVDLEQGFLQFEPTIRIRKIKKGSEKPAYELTVKEAAYKLVRNEFNMEISEEEFENMKKDVKGPMVEKTRYILPNDITVDLHHGKYGYKFDDYAEIEFKTVKASKDFNAKSFPWLGEEITGREAKSYRSICKDMWKRKK